jgi:sugar lactone lactonase YvrE
MATSRAGQTRSTGRSGGLNSSRSSFLGRCRLFMVAASMTAVIGVGGAVVVSQAPAGAATPSFPTPAVPGGVQSPSNAGSNPSEVLLSTACTQAGGCVAVGYYLDSSNKQQPLIETETLGAWTPLEAPLPPDGSVSTYAFLNDVVCPVAGSCVAVGSYRDTSNDLEGLIETLSAGVWTPTEAPLPLDSSGPSAFLNGVACTSATACVAVGGYNAADSTTLQEGLIETLVSGVWTPTQAPEEVTGVAAKLYGISCPTTTLCIAVGQYGPSPTQGQLGLIETLSGGVWLPSEAPVPSDALTSPVTSEQVVLAGVSCGEPDQCEAVGNYVNTAGKEGALVESYQVGTWTNTSANVSAGVGTTNYSALYSVSCPAGGLCVAVGIYLDSTNHKWGLIDGSSASSPLGGMQAPLLPDTTNGVLYGVDCTAIGACESVGTYVDSNNHSQGLAEVSKAPGPFTVYQDPEIDNPSSITTGPDSALWFTNDEAPGAIGTISTGGQISTYTDPTIDDPNSITTDPDGNLWFTNLTAPSSSDDGSIGQITPTGTVANFTDPTIDQPTSITAGPDGNLWFTNSDVDGVTSGTGSIGNITPGAPNTVTNYTDPSIDDPTSITAGPDGNLWFTNAGNNSIGMITPAGVVSNFTDPTIDDPQSIVAVPGGNLWFTNAGNNSIGTITTAGVVSNFTDVSIDDPQSITVGSDGALWYTNSASGTIGRITTAGVVTSYENSGVSQPEGITSGPDGALWFTDASSTITSDGIGRVTTPDVVTSATVPSAATIGVQYPTTTLSASGGTAPYTWSISAGALPAGLSLSTGGVITGTPASAQTSNFTVEASDHTYPGSTATQAETITVAPLAPGPYTPMSPVRICDTRPNNPSDLTGAAAQCNGYLNLGTTLAAGGTLNVEVANEFGVPADANAVVLNVTVVNPGAPGYITAYPTDSAQPVASNVNYVAGQVVPNLIEVGIGTGGDVSFFSSSKSNLVVDVEGFVSPDSQDGAGLYVPLSSPTRICDTRGGNPSELTGAATQCNGYLNLGSTLPAGGSINVNVAGAFGVPPGATAAVLNVTVANPAAAGYLAAYPQGTTQPFASNVNYTAGQVTANRVIVPVSLTGTTPGDITVYSSAKADVIVDVSGYYTAASGTGTQFTSEGAPVRICDTRSGNPSGLIGADSQCNGETIGAGQTLVVNVAGLAGVPATGATAVVVNLTGVAPSAPTFLTVFPGPTRPFASDLNPAVGAVAANLVVATLSSSGTISIYNSAGNVNVVVDVLGWYS